MAKPKPTLSEDAERIYREMTNGARLVTRTRALDRFGAHALIREGKAFSEVTGSQLQELRRAKRIEVIEPSDCKYLLCYVLVSRCPLTQAALGEWTSTHLVPPGSSGSAIASIPQFANVILLTRHRHPRGMKFAPRTEHAQEAPGLAPQVGHSKSRDVLCIAAAELENDYAKMLISLNPSS